MGVVAPWLGLDKYWCVPAVITILRWLDLDIELSSSILWIFS